MMDFTLLAVGNLKEGYLREGVAEYLKRMKAYASVKVIEVPEERRNNPEETVREEGKAILGQVKEGAYVICLAVEGREMDSPGLARHLEEVFTYRSSQVYLIIGGSHGLSPEVLARADLKLSFSRFTYPHQLMRLILAEQLYRAMKISRGEPYHK